MPKENILLESSILNKKIKQRVANLISESRFKREPPGQTNCEIKNSSGDIFKIDIFEDGNDPKLSEIQNLFNETFKREEVESEIFLRSAIDGKTPWGTPDIKYRVISITNKEEELLTVCAGATLELSDTDNEVAYCVEYLLTNKKLKQKGLAREVYISALIDSLKIAEEKNKKLSFLFGECTDSSETFWNKMGWKRIYLKNKDTNKYIEVPYIQPVLNFNTETGEKSKDSGEIKEHLMIDFLNREPTIKDLLKLHEALINYTAMWSKEAFKNEEAYEKHMSYINNLKLTFEKNITQEQYDKKLYFLSGEQKAHLNYNI